MNTANTPAHVRLWHRDFWLLVIASLLLTMSVYVLLPAMPRWMMEEENFTPGETGLAMGVFAVGLYTLGALCSWLVQRYRRNVVCMWAMAAVASAAAMLWYIDSQRSEFAEQWGIVLLRFLQGAAFGLAQMVLSSTLIVDTCESSQRTAANHGNAWVSRLALSLGPLTGLLVSDSYGFGFGGAAVASVAAALLALVMVRSVKFPFRTPADEVHVVSLDRFFLPHGTVLFVNLVLVSTVVGMMLALPLGVDFYLLMMGGFVLALLAQRFAFREAELKSEVVSGLFLLFAALLVLLVSPLSPVAPVLTGLGVGVIASRFLLFFVKLSHHCQRGTAQSSCFLGWETGIALGLAAGYGLFYNHPVQLLYTALALTAAALAMYHFYTHQWFIRNKNR